MQESILEFLKCPVCQRDLQLQIIKTAEKKFESGIKTVIESGIFTCSCNFIFPIVDFVPRMLIESFADYEDFLQHNIPSFLEIKQNLISKYSHAIEEAKKRNRQTKSSFSFEWNLLKGKKKVKVWHLSDEEYKRQLFNELNLPQQYFENKLAIDVGCGHGRATLLLSERCKTAIGMDLGASVIKACQDNLFENCHFIQADLHCPPFSNGLFDIVYSSGVLHHTSDTERAFGIVSDLVRKGGICCVWLYKPYKNVTHNSIIALRRITTHLPLKLQFWVYLILFVPLHKFVAWLRHRKPRPWREIMIELLDTFSPRYRFEHDPDEVKLWFAKKHFMDIEVTTVDNIGFSMKGDKSKT